MIFGFVKMMSEKKKAPNPLTEYPNGCEYRRICPFYYDMSHFLRPENVSIPNECNSLTEIALKCPQKLLSDSQVEKGKIIFEYILDNAAELSERI